MAGCNSEQVSPVTGSPTAVRHIEADTKWLTFWRRHFQFHIEGLMQKRRNSIAIALELHIFCIKLSISFNENVWILLNFTDVCFWWSNTDWGNGLAPDRLTPLGVSVWQDHATVQFQCNNSCFMTPNHSRLNKSLSSYFKIKHYYFTQDSVHL